MKQREILINLICMTCIWITGAFNYYMIGLQVKYLPGIFETNVLLMYLADIPANFLAGYLPSKLGAKTIFLTAFAVQVFAGLAIVFFVDPVNPTWKLPVLLSLARLGVGITLTSVWIVHP